MPVDRTSIQMASFPPEQFADVPEAVAEDRIKFIEHRPVPGGYVRAVNRFKSARVAVPDDQFTGVMHHPDGLIQEFDRGLIVRSYRVESDGTQTSLAKFYGLRKKRAPKPTRPALSPEQQRIADTLARANGCAHERQDEGIIGCFRRHGAEP